MITLTRPAGTADGRARFLREHVYATYTGLAVVAALAIGIHHATAVGAITTLLVAIVAITLAGFVSDLVSHQIAHGTSPKGPELATMASIALGALASASIPFVALAAAVFGLIPVELALQLSIGIYFVTLLVTSAVATARTATPMGQRLGAIALLLGLGAVVVLMLVIAHLL
jgi:large-conductance mechanosensitive channel